MSNEHLSQPPPATGVAYSTTGQHVPSPIARGLAFFLVGLVGLHFLITFLWNAPSNPIREAVNGQVTGYIQPFFQQNWSLFAPNPINAQEEVWVRARLVGPQTGAVAITEWVSATQLEWTIVRHNPAPARVNRLSSNLSRRINTAWNELTAEQRDIVAQDHLDMTDWRPLADDLIEAQGGQASSRIASMVRVDRVATGYATQLAEALWGKNVVAVQFQLRRTPVPRWEERNEPTPDRSASTIRDFGWRPLLVDRNQDESLFAHTIERLRR